MPATSQGSQKKIVIHHQIVKNGETKQFLADLRRRDAGRQEDEPTTAKAKNNNTTSKSRFTA